MPDAEKITVHDVEEITNEVAAVLDTEELYNLRTRAMQVLGKVEKAEDGDGELVKDVLVRDLLAGYNAVWRELEKRGEKIEIGALERAALQRRLQLVKVKEQWEAVAYLRHGECPIAAEDRTWSAASESKEAEADDLAMMFLFENVVGWVDESADRGAYMGPHHYAEKKHPVSWTGVEAAMVRLKHADIPEDEVRAGWVHLAAHYKQFGKTAPTWEDVQRRWSVQRHGCIEKCKGVAGNIVRSVRVQVMKADEAAPPEVMGVLAYRGQIDDTPLGDKVWDWVIRNYLTGASWSGWPIAVQMYNYPALSLEYVLDIELIEISVVTLPGDEHVELKVVDEAKRIIEGTVTSEYMNYLRKYVLPSAFKNVIPQYMKLAPFGTMFLNHDTNMPVGKYLEFEVKEVPIELPEALGELRTREGRQEALASREAVFTKQRAPIVKPRIKVMKMDDELHEVGGIVYAPISAAGTDSQGDWATTSDIHDAMVSYMIHSQQADIMHDRDRHPDLKLVECFQAEEDTVKGNGIVPAGAWYVCIKVLNTEKWQRVKDGELTGFSLEGDAEG